jgi:hypothetical protein
MSDMMSAKAGLEKANPGIVVELDIQGGVTKALTSPDAQKQLAAAANIFLVRFRNARSYPKFIVEWFEVRGFENLPQQSSTQPALSTTDVRFDQDQDIYVVLLQFPSLPRGGYRVILSGEDFTGKRHPIDNQTYYYDGTRFLEQ